MRTALAVLLTSHALIHLMGFLKAFGFAELPQLANPISRPLGIAWLVASLALLGAATTLFWTPRSFWLAAGFAVVISQFVIVSSWSDAKFGTAPNLILLLAVVHSAFSDGPFGLHAAYAREVRLGLAPGIAIPVTEADLNPLPPPVQRYLRLVGVVGQPRVSNYRIRFVGRIRGAADAPWMAFTGEQLSFTDDLKRLFMMDATMKGTCRSPSTSCSTSRNP